jgi:hypothetical protein
MSRLYTDDHEQIQSAFVIYDALYAWLRYARDETHSWNPQRKPNLGRSRGSELR